MWQKAPKVHHMYLVTTTGMNFRHANMWLEDTVNHEYLCPRKIQIFLRTQPLSLGVHQLQPVMAPGS